MNITNLETRKAYLESAIKESEAQIAPIREELRQVLKDLAIERSPFKPGDIVERKTNGDRFQISGVNYRYGWLSAYKLKVDGTPGKVEKDLFYASNYTLVKSAAESGTLDEESLGRR